MRYATAALLGLILLTAPTGVPAQEEKGEEQKDPNLWDQVLTFYESAKEQGEQVPKDVYEWVRNDLGSVGDWEYKLFELQSADTATIEKKLNELGTDRWECLWVQPVGVKTRFYMKRPSRTYLKNLPLSQLLKMIPAGGGGE
jgi:hypothetical protein